MEEVAYGEATGARRWLGAKRKWGGALTTPRPRRAQRECSAAQEGTQDMFETEFDRDTRRNETDNARALAATRALSGMWDGNADDLDGPPDVVQDVRDAAVECVRVHLMRAADAAYSAALAPFEQDSYEANMTHIFGTHYGLSKAEAAAVNRCIDAVCLPVASWAQRLEAARLREIAVRAAGAWLAANAPTRRGRGKYMLMVRGLDRAA